MTEEGGAAPAPTTSDPGTVAHDRPPAPFASRGMPDAIMSFVTGLVVGLVSAGVISRLYGVNVVGEFALISAPYALVMSLSTLGEQVALIRVLSVESPGSRRTASLFLVVLAFSVVMTVAICALSAGVAWYLLHHVTHRPDLFAPAGLLLLTYATIGNASWNIDGMMAAFRATRPLLLTKTTELTCLLAASIGFAAVIGPTKWALVWATMLAAATSFLLRLSFALRLIKGRPTLASLRSARGELKSILRFGVRVVPGMLAYGLSAQAGTWIIGTIRSVGVLGAYSRAFNLANRLTEAGFRLGDVVLPFLSDACQRHDYASACRQFSRWRLLVALGLGLACAPVAGAAEGLLSLFGPGFSQSASALGLLLAAYSLSVINAMHGYFLLALGLPTRSSQLIVFRAAVTLAAIVPFAISLGAAGAAAAVLLGFAVELPTSLYVLNRRLHELGHANTWPHVPSLLACVAIGALVARVGDVVTGASPAGALLATVAGAAAFTAAAIGRGLVPREDLARALARLPFRR